MNPYERKKSFIAVLCIVIIVLVTFDQASRLRGLISNGRKLQSPESSSSCLPQRTLDDMLSLPPVTPIFTAAYPGSGSKMTWRIIRAITGRLTGDDMDHDGTVSKHQVVAVKTHYPSLTPATVFFSERHKDIRQSILLLRNPLAAIPSFHNWNWEQQHGLLEHSTRAPTVAWIQWRNEHFEEELKAWSKQLRYWVHRNSRDNTLHLIQFERMISPQYGVDELHSLAKFLAGVSPDIEKYMVQLDLLECTWKAIIQGEGGDSREQVFGTHHRTGGYNLGNYPFTEVQVDATIRMLQQVYFEYAKDYAPLQPILNNYIQACTAMKDQIVQLGGNVPSWEQEHLQAHPLFQLLLDVDRPVAKADKGIPYYWYVDQSGEKNMKHILSCLGRTQNQRLFTLRCSEGEHELKVCRYREMNSVNADLSSTEGIQRAKELQLTHSNIPDLVLESSRFHEGMTLFSQESPGRLFVLFRDPVERALSNYYPTFYRTGQKMSMLEYADSPHCPSNYMTRMLVDKEQGDLSPNHLQLAKTIIQKKCLVLLLSDMDESINRLVDYFQWPVADDQLKCARRYSVEAPINSLNPYANKLPVPTRGSKEWEVIRERNLFDLELYEYAQQLFREQEALQRETHQVQYF